MAMGSRLLAEISIDLDISLISTGCCPSTSPLLVSTSVAWYVSLVICPIKTFQMVHIIEYISSRDYF